MAEKCHKNQVIIGVESAIVSVLEESVVVSAQVPDLSGLHESYVRKATKANARKIPSQVTACRNTQFRFTHSRSVCWLFYRSRCLRVYWSCPSWRRKSDHVLRKTRGSLSKIVESGHSKSTFDVNNNLELQTW